MLLRCGQETTGEPELRRSSCRVSGDIFLKLVRQRSGRLLESKVVSTFFTISTRRRAAHELREVCLEGLYNDDPLRIEINRNMCRPSLHALITSGSDNFTSIWTEPSSSEGRMTATKSRMAAFALSRLGSVMLRQATGKFDGEQIPDQTRRGRHTSACIDVISASLAGRAVEPRLQILMNPLRRDFTRAVHIRGRGSRKACEV